MPDVTLRVQSVTSREREGVTRVVLVLDYLGTTPVDFEAEIQAGQDVKVKVPSENPPPPPNP